MVDFKKLSAQAKYLVEKRGGTDALKQDASELARDREGQGHISDKAKAAAAALKESGAKEPADPAAAAAPAADASPKPDPAAPTRGEKGDLDEVERKAERRKERAERKAGSEDPAS